MVECAVRFTGSASKLLVKASTALGSASAQTAQDNTIAGLIPRRALPVVLPALIAPSIAWPC